MRLYQSRNIEEYIGRGGYKALHKALSEMTPEEVIGEVKQSGLRGRGGAGFPTGQKWAFRRQAPGDIKYVICNADEGDPGAFMDRSILEGRSSRGHRRAWPSGPMPWGPKRAISMRGPNILWPSSTCKGPLPRLRNMGLLGDRIFGTSFGFRLKIREGAGAFVCGEETALIASIEGKVGEPRPRPPFPAQRGLWDCPTNINNVKTWSHIAPIIAGAPTGMPKWVRTRPRGPRSFP